MKRHNYQHLPKENRHARRLFVGNLIPDYITENDLRDFLNSTIYQALNEKPVKHKSHVLSVYIDKIKWFALVELDSIELTEACVALNGIMYNEMVLKIERAHEYRPDLIPLTPPNRVIHLDLSDLVFAEHDDEVLLSPSSIHPQYGLTTPATTINRNLCFGSLIKYVKLNEITEDSIVIVGVPFYPPSLPENGFGVNANNSSYSTSSFRNAILKSAYGNIINYEYDVNLTTINFCDIGDVPTGKNIQESLHNLTSLISKIILRGAVPFVIGISSDEFFNSACGLINGVGVNNSPIGVININPKLDSRLLDDVHTKFCSRIINSSSVTCDQRYVQFAAQV
jgi:hypothetical protein